MHPPDVRAHSGSVALTHTEALAVPSLCLPPPQFQLYEWITPALNEPTQFRTQSLFVLQPVDVAYMIETYYSYDEAVMRDLLGKSLTKAAMRDIQDQAEMLGIKVNSTRRQFDNLKRILTRIEQQMLANKGAPASRSILTGITQVRPLLRGP